MKTIPFNSLISFFSYLNFVLHLSDFPSIKLCKLGVYVVSGPSGPPHPDPDLHMPVSQTPLSTYLLLDDCVQQETLPRNAGSQCLSKQLNYHVHVLALGLKCSLM